MDELMRQIYVDMYGINKINTRQFIDPIEMKPLDLKKSDPNQGPSSLVPSKYNLMPVYDPADQLVYDQYGEMGPPVPPVMFDNMSPMFGESGVEKDGKLPKPQNLDDVQQTLANAQVLNKDAQPGLLDNYTIEFLNKETEDLPNISKANDSSDQDQIKNKNIFNNIKGFFQGKEKGEDKKKPDKAELYYAMSMGQNLGATISNMLQDSPPVISLQKNYLKRQKMDPTIYRNIMEDINEGVAMQTRKLREGAGQMSDFLVGTAATGVGLNRAIQKLGEQARQDLAKTTAMNTQIANQEIAGLSETLNKEKLINYQNKQQHAAQKQAALSDNMSNMNKIMRGFADYQYKKDLMNKQQTILDEQVADQNKLNALTAMITLNKSVKSDPSYRQGYIEAINTEREVRSKALEDEYGIKFSDITEEKITKENEELNNLKSLKLSNEKEFEDLQSEYRGLLLTPDSYNKILAQKRLAENLPEDPTKNEELWESIPENEKINMLIQMREETDDFATDEEKKQFQTVSELFKKNEKERIANEENINSLQESIDKDLNMLEKRNIAFKNIDYKEIKKNYELSTGIVPTAEIYKELYSLTQKSMKDNRE